MAQLSDAKARNIKPDDTPLPHGGVTGLTLHPSTTKGRGKWVFRFVSPVTKKRRNAGLGTYPEISIADAGKQGQSMRELLAKGSDPLDHRELESNKPSIPTFADAVHQVHDSLRPGWKNPKHEKQWLKTLEDYALPAIGHLTVDMLTPSHFANLLKPIWLSVPDTAKRVKQRMHAVMDWAWAHEYCNSNPVKVVHKLLPIQPTKDEHTKHHPAMDWRYVPTFVHQHLSEIDQFDAGKSLMLFVMLTGCRSKEAREMTWDEINWDKSIWLIPAERMKAKQMHRVPLSKQAVALLKNMIGLHSSLVFPSPRKQVPLSDMALTSFLRRVKAPSTTPGRHATAHGFRSTLRDWCSEQGYPKDLAERALAHKVENKVEAAYHRTDLLEQRRPMMDTWAEFIANSQPSK